MPTVKDVLLKVFGATTMSDMLHVVKRDEATKVGEIKMSASSDTRTTFLVVVIPISIRISFGILWY